MYKLTTILKHKIQVEFDENVDMDLIKKCFKKLRMYLDTETEMKPLQEWTKVSMVVLSTKQNIIHVFNMLGLSPDNVKEVAPNDKFVRSIYRTPKVVRREKRQRAKERRRKRKLLEQQSENSNQAGSSNIE